MSTDALSASTVARPLSIRLREKPLRTALQVVLVLLVGWNLFAFSGRDHEQLATVHYMPGLEFYYGGYGNKYWVYPDRFIPIQRETEFNYKNMEALLDKRPARAPAPSPFMTGYDAGGRMFPSGFLPSAIQRLSFGTLDVRTAYLLSNILLWSLGIFIAYRFARSAFRDIYSPWIAAALIACYPVFTLMFRSMKIQYAHGILIPCGIYVAHFALRRMNLFLSSCVLTGLFIVSAFSGAGHILLLAALASWLFACHTVGRNTKLMAGIDMRSSVRLGVATVIGFAVAHVLTTYVRNRYNFPNTSAFYDMRQTFVTDTYDYAMAWIQGTDRSKLRFLGFPGDLFFTDMLGRFIKSLWYSNPVVILGAIVAYIFYRETRVLILTAALMFLPGHGTEMLAQWVGSYGYSNGATMLLLIVAFAGMAGALLSADREVPVSIVFPRVTRAGTLVVFAAAVGFFLTNRKDHFDNYYFSWGRLNAGGTIYVYHDGKLTMKY